MSKKDIKITTLIEKFSGKELSPHYLAYFECFNQQDYYDAHDVLEALWLSEGKEGPNYHYFKGLIQAAGAFVHLQLNYRHPDHPAHSRRLPPSGRLFRRALYHLGLYPASHLALDLIAFRSMCELYLLPMEASSFTLNPWTPERAPVVSLLRA